MAIPIVGGVAAVLVALLVERALAERARAREQKARRERLVRKYGSGHIVNAILERRLHRGMSSDMVRDTLGAPTSVIQLEDGAQTWVWYPSTADPRTVVAHLEQDFVVDWQG